MILFPTAVRQEAFSFIIQDFWRDDNTKRKKKAGVAADLLNL